MNRLSDEDGVDGPFERGMAKAKRARRNNAELKRAMGQLAHADRTLANLEQAVDRAINTGLLENGMMAALVKARQSYRDAVRVSLLAYGDSAVVVERAS